jgi:hypothetical protein
MTACRIEEEAMLSEGERQAGKLFDIQKSLK